MIVSIHQPNYLPYLGFFRKMLHSDIFILYDTAQYSKNEFHNRNRIKTARGVQWLTVPVRRTGLQPIRSVEIARNLGWAAKHRKAIEANYRRATHYSSYAPELAEILSRDWNGLSDLNTEVVKTIARWLSISTKIVLTSQLPQPPSDDPTEKILWMVGAVGGDSYLSGPGGRDYLDSSKFGSVRLEYSDFTARPYPQLHGAFVPNLSVVDALLNCGKGARELIA